MDRQVVQKLVSAKRPSISVCGDNSRNYYTIQYYRLCIVSHMNAIKITTLNFVLCENVLKYK